MAEVKFLWNKCVFYLVGAIALAGCRAEIFDPSETLPAYPGVSSRLMILEGDEKKQALRNFSSDPDHERAIVVQQVIQNDSEEKLALYLNPRFRAERIVVKTADGDPVPLSAYSREKIRKWRWSRRSDVGASGILPQETQKRAYILSRLFDLSEPGTYTAEIESRYAILNEPDNKRFYETNPEPITFEVK